MIPGVTYVSCSWCHELNPTTRQWCATCGHAAQVPRILCTCLDCITQWALAMAADRTTEAQRKEK